MDARRSVTKFLVVRKLRISIEACPKGPGGPTKIVRPTGQFSWPAFRRIAGLWRRGEGIFPRDESPSSHAAGWVLRANAEPRKLVGGDASTDGFLRRCDYSRSRTRARWVPLGSGGSTGDNASLRGYQSPWPARRRRSADRQDSDDRRSRTVALLAAGLRRRDGEDRSAAWGSGSGDSGSRENSRRLRLANIRLL